MLKSDSSKVSISSWLSILKSTLLMLISIYSPVSSDSRNYWNSPIWNNDFALKFKISFKCLNPKFIAIWIRFRGHWILERTIWIFSTLSLLNKKLSSWKFSIPIPKCISIFLSSGKILKSIWEFGNKFTPSFRILRLSNLSNPLSFGPYNFWIKSCKKSPWILRWVQSCLNFSGRHSLWACRLIQSPTVL